MQYRYAIHLRESGDVVDLNSELGPTLWKSVRNCELAARTGHYDIPNKWGGLNLKGMHCVIAEPPYAAGEHEYVLPMKIDAASFSMDQARILWERMRPSSKALCTVEGVFTEVKNGVVPVIYASLIRKPRLVAIKGGGVVSAAVRKQYRTGE